MKLLLIGDVMLGRLVNEYLKNKPPEDIFGNTLSVFKQADLKICNLECTISDRGEPVSYNTKPFHFRTDPKNVKTLVSAEINLCSLANNHILDYGPEALSDTISALNKANIAHVGAGNNIYEAEKPTVLKSNDLTVGVWGITDNEPAWEANLETPGTNYMPINPDDGRVKHLIDHIHELRDSVDLIVISVHWGGNWGYRSPQEQIEFAHGLIDAGADVIYGHSPHIFRGIEIYNDRPILYSTGDFIDDYAIDEIEKNDQSFIFILDCDNKKINKIEMYPVVINNFRVHLANDTEQEEIILKMSDLCDDFDTAIRKNPGKNYYEILLK